MEWIVGAPELQVTGYPTNLHSPASGRCCIPKPPAPELMLAGISNVYRIMIITKKHMKSKSFYRPNGWVLFIKSRHMTFVPTAHPVAWCPSSRGEEPGLVPWRASAGATFNERNINCFRQNTNKHPKGDHCMETTTGWKGAKNHMWKVKLRGLYHQRS